MKLKASSFLSEGQFWKIIEKSLKGNPDMASQIENLSEELKKLSKTELIGFKYHIDNFSNKSYSSNLWAVAYIVMNGCSDDGFDYFRHWLISRGEKVFKNALKDPDSLFKEFDKIAEDDIPDFEDFSYLPMDIFEEKFGNAFYEEEEEYDFEDAFKRPEIKLNWSEDDLESLKNICPKTFEKWWDNDRF